MENFNNKFVLAEYPKHGGELFCYTEKGIVCSGYGFGYEGLGYWEVKVEGFETDYLGWYFHARYNPDNPLKIALFLPNSNTFVAIAHLNIEKSDFKERKKYGFQDSWTTGDDIISEMYRQKMSEAEKEEEQRKIKVKNYLLELRHSDSAQNYDHAVCI